MPKNRNHGTIIQTPSQTNWRPQNPLKRPAVMRLLSYQAIAHGSDLALFFQWRQSQAAPEMYHGAVVSHAGHEHTRVFREVAALGKELAGLGKYIVGTRITARVALVLSWTNWWNVEYQPGLSNLLQHIDELTLYYRLLWGHNIAVDVISPDADFQAYDLVLVPLLNTVSARQGASIERYVEAGGTFATGFFSGVVDEHNRAWLGGYPGPLRKVLGIWVEEFDPLLPQETNQILVSEESWLPQGTYQCDQWCDVLHLEGARSLATYGQDFYAGHPAITEHHFGAGCAYYVATHVEATLLQALIEKLCADLEIRPPLEVPAGVEVTQRVGTTGNYLFALNHKTEPVQLNLPMPLWNLLWPSPRLPFDFPAKPVRMLNWRTPSESRIDSSPRGDTPSFSPDLALF